MEYMERIIIFKTGLRISSENISQHLLISAFRKGAEKILTYLTTFDLVNWAANPTSDDFLGIFRPMTLIPDPCNQGPAMEIWEDNERFSIVE